MCGLGRLESPIAKILQDITDEEPNRVVVLDQQHGLTISFSYHLRCRRGLAVDLDIGRGQKDAHSCARAD